LSEVVNRPRTLKIADSRADVRAPRPDQSRDEFLGERKGDYGG